MKCIAILVVLASSTASAQSRPDARAVVTVGVSGSELERQAYLFTGAAQGVNRAADWGLDTLLRTTHDRNRKGGLIRFARLWLVNLPVASLTQVHVHDSGHFARLREQGVSSWTRETTRWPWPLPLTYSIEYPNEERTFSPRAELAIQGGGEEGSRTLAGHLLDRIYEGESASYFDWVLYGYSKLDFSMYALTDLRDGSTGSGDFNSYAWLLLNATREEDRTEARLAHYRSDLRQAAVWNLADFSVVAGFARLGQYVVTGERQTGNMTLRLGPVRFVPGGYATLTPDGPEKGVDVRLLGNTYLTTVSAGAISTVSDTHLWRASGQIQPRSNTRILPEVRASIWQRSSARIGGSLEVGAKGRMRVAGRDVGLGGRVGYKTPGYLAGHPEKASVLASATVSAIF